MSLTPRLDKIQKNYLINGDMRIAQRGVSFVSPADSTYSLDRMAYYKIGTMAHTITQDTDVPTLAQSGYLFQNSLRLNLTTPDTSIAAGDYLVFGQNIEGYVFAPIAQKTLTLSFWVKATLTGTYCVAFRNSISDRSMALEYTVNAANTWEKKVLTVPASPVDGTWNYSNGIGLKIYWVLACGTTFQTTGGAWQNGNFFATSSQINAVNTGATDFRLTGIMLNEGEIEDPSFTTFGRNFTEEIAACQRYYEKSYNIGIFPGGLSGAGQGIFNNNDSAGSRNPFFYMPFKVTKRITAASTTIYNPTTGAAGSARGSDAGNYTVDNVSAGEQGLLGRIVSLPALVSGSIHFVTDAEL